MNFKHIQYVLTIVQEGSITAASRKLEVSQPALSQTVKLIERDLGTLIFNRDTDPISLTDQGKKYVEAGRRIMDIMDTFQEEVVRTKQEVRGKIRIGISIQRGRAILPHVISEFRLQYPLVKIELVEHGSVELEKMVCQGMCDLALLTTGKHASDLCYLPLQEEHIVLLAANSTRIAQRIPDRTPISICEARDEQFVSMAKGHSIRAIQDRLFETHHLSPEIFLETRNMEAAAGICAYANAVMLIPDVYLEQQEDLRAYIHIYPVLDNAYERHFCLCHRRERVFTQYMEEFIRIVCGELNVPFHSVREG